MQAPRPAITPNLTAGILIHMIPEGLCEHDHICYNQLNYWGWVGSRIGHRTKNAKRIGKVGYVKLSIAMATYNGANFLRSQLDSLAAQTLLPDELVVSDDGSTDDTLVILQEFQKVAPFAMIIHQNPHRTGYVQNFLGTVSQCSGDVIAFCDQDDVWLPQKLDVVLKKMDRDRSALVVHTATLVDDGLEQTGGHLPHIVRSQTLPQGKASDGPMKSFPLGFCLVFRRDVAESALRRLKNYPESYAYYFGHEMPIYLTAKALDPVTYLSESLALYRRHGNNASRGAKPDSSWSRLTQGATAYQKFAEHQHVRANFLRWMAQNGQPDDLVSVFFRRLSTVSARHADLMERRAALYGQPTRRKKASALAGLLVRRGYGGRRHGGLGLKSLVKDLWNVIR